MVLILIILGVLLTISFVTHTLASKAEVCIEASNRASFHRLQRKFFIVYFFATFADWLQGPYIYKVYSNYGYTEPQIAMLYVSGFFSSMVFGTAVGVLADRFGRKKLCVAYSVLYSISCLTKISPQYSVLIFGRLLGGVCTSILFSTFEAWYVYEHLERHRFPSQWINITLAKATFYNGVLAIGAGVLSNLAAEAAELGPVSPFMIAIPCLLLSGVLTAYAWEENDLSAVVVPEVAGSRWYKCASLRTIFHPDKVLVLQLGLIQSLFEAVMYTFVFLWTPVLEPIRPPLGIVFSCFMLCMMIGSSLYSFLFRKYAAETLLKACIGLGLVALAVSAMAMKMVYKDLPSTGEYTQLALVAFMVYEIAVGMYFPAVGYLRSQVVPEQYRASIANWYRVPMNIFTCASLLWLKNVARIGAHGSFAFEMAASSHSMFVTCCFLLVIAMLIAWRFAKHRHAEVLVPT